MQEQDLANQEERTSQQLSKEALVPLLEEQLSINKRVVETGTVRLRVQTEERRETVQVPVTRVSWQVDRVPINEVVTELPGSRQEGQTTIYPVVEERVRTIRELVLVEEVRVTRRAVTTMETSSHLLRRERLSEERVSATSERP